MRCVCFFVVPNEVIDRFDGTIGASEYRLLVFSIDFNARVKVGCALIALVNL